LPVVTALFAYILFGERLDSVSILGMLVCTSGVALVNRGIARPAEVSSAMSAFGDKADMTRT
jgi:drug/metabolite transporter (DMT)-like permease